MIVCKDFDGDDSDFFKEMQHSLYGELVGRLFDTPMRRLYDSATLMNLDHPLVSKGIELEYIDHRDFQWQHDLLAARFRFEWFRDNPISVPPGFIQESLFSNSAGEGNVDLSIEWSNWFTKKVEEITFSNDEFVWLAVKTGVYGGGTPEGREASWKLGNFLYNFYAGNWVQGSRFEKVYGRV